MDSESPVFLGGGLEVIESMKMAVLIRRRSGSIEIKRNRITTTRGYWGLRRPSQSGSKGKKWNFP